MKTHRIKMTTPSLYLALLFLLIQQGIVGLSTYFIANLAIDIAQKDNFLINLGGFVLSLIIVYIPAYFATIFLEKSKFDLLNNYVQKFIMTFFGKTALLNNKELKDQSTVFIGQESKAVVDDMLDFAFDGMALILNLLINILILGFFLDYNLLVAYIIGFLLVELFIFYHKNKISKISTTSQKSRISFISILNKSWDNIIIYNKYNIDIFNKIYQCNFNRSKKYHINSQSFNNIISSTGMLLFMLPVLSLIMYLFIKHQDNYTFLALLVATLPRQIQLLQMGQALVFHQTNFSSIKARFIGLQNSLNVPSIDILNRINFQQIFINNAPLSDFDLNSLPKNGRMTIKGRNGAGKSSFLLYLKTLLSNRAFYLPVSHDLFFHQNNKKSTGQKLLSQLMEIRNNKSNIDVIILDEWDANLDNANKNYLDELINELAKEKLVVEVRHL